MGMPAARVGDMHVCPMVTGTVPHVGGPVLPPCEPKVLTGGRPQARIGDMATCAGAPDVIALGAMTVLVGGKPAARMLDTTVHGGKIVVGEPTVLIGDNGSASSGTLGMELVAAMIAAEGSGAAAAVMKQALIAAAKAGVPFCEQCLKAALAGK
jgi:uncharacterized Zn-binding protein involved in type VI secretion